MGDQIRIDLFIRGHKRGGVFANASDVAFISALVAQAMTEDGAELRITRIEAMSYDASRKSTLPGGADDVTGIKSGGWRRRTMAEVCGAGDVAGGGAIVRSY